MRTTVLHQSQRESLLRVIRAAVPEWNPHIVNCIVADNLNASWNDGMLFVVIANWQWHGHAQMCPLHDEIAGLFANAQHPAYTHGDNNVWSNPQPCD